MNSLDEEVQMKLLQIDSSARTSSVTRRLTARFAEEWEKNHPQGEVIRRDLSATALPQITDDWSATYLEDSKLTPEQRSYLSTSDELIEELRAADTVVIGAPMYNFSISSSLKAWIDQIVRVGKTISYGPNGPQGLLAKKKVVVITSRGGAYEKGTAREAFDFQEPWLRHVLGFIGLTDVTFIHAENQAREQAAVSFAAVAERIGRIVMVPSHWMALAGAVQLLGGLLVLAGRTAPLGLVLLGPVLVNILAFHICLTGGHGIAPGLVFSVLEIFLIYAYRGYFRAIFTANALPT